LENANANANKPRTVHSGVLCRCKKRPTDPLTQIFYVCTISRMISISCSHRFVLLCLREVGDEVEDKVVSDKVEDKVVSDKVEDKVVSDKVAARDGDVGPK
jgi:hypothetical protein